MPHFSAIYGSSLKTELARNKTDDKAIALHSYSSFYFVFDILEREKSFQIGSVTVPKEMIDKLRPEPKRTHESEQMGKFATFLNNLDTLNRSSDASLSALGKEIRPFAVEFAKLMKIDHSYQSLLTEGLGSIRKTRDFDKKGHVLNGMSM